MGKVGFIGVGQMASAILKGSMQSKVLRPEQIGLFDVNVEKLNSYKNQGCLIFDSIEDLVKHSNTVIIAVKPQNFTEVLPFIKKGIAKETVLVSIAAGITGEQIQKSMGFLCKVVVVMPNTPALLGFGSTGMAKLDTVSDDEFYTIKTIFSSIGSVVEVTPSQLNTVIPISGSSPALIYKLADDIVKYANKNGLDSDKAMKLFAQTLIGSAKMLVELDKTPAELISMVSSKGGTTIAGLKALEDNGFNNAIDAYCEACVNRANQLTALNGVMVKQVDYKSDGYNKAVVLREKVLRQPLGLKLSEKDMADDSVMAQFIVLSEGNVVAAGQLLEKDIETGQVKQVVVEPSWQKTGLGKVIMEEVHKYAVKRGYKKLVLHARDYAIGFYEKLGYKVTDEKFEIMGVPHTTMFLNLM